MALKISNHRVYPLDNIPDYVLLNILQMLSIEDLCKAARISHKFRSIVLEDVQVQVLLTIADMFSSLSDSNFACSPDMFDLAALETTSFQRRLAFTGSVNTCSLNRLYLAHFTTVCLLDRATSYQSDIW